MAEPSEHTFIHPFVYPFRLSAQPPYPCNREFIRSSDPQQTSEAVHLYSSNPRPLLLLPYLLSHYHTQEEARAVSNEDPSTRKLQTSSITET